MHIEIAIVGDDGNRRVLGSNKSVSQHGAGRAWEETFDVDAIRSMTPSEQWAASQLLHRGCFERLAADPTNVPLMAAVAAYRDAIARTQLSSALSRLANPEQQRKFVTHLAATFANEALSVVEEASRRNRRNADAKPLDDSTSPNGDDDGTPTPAT